MKAFLQATSITALIGIIISVIIGYIFGFSNEVMLFLSTFIYILVVVIPFTFLSDWIDRKLGLWKATMLLFILWACLSVLYLSFKLIRGHIYIRTTNAIVF